MSGRHVTIVVHTDGELKTRQFRLPLTAFRVSQGLAIALGVFILLFFAFAGPIIRAAGSVPALRGDVARLRADSARVGELAAELNRAESRYEELRDILGARAPSGSRALPQTEIRRARTIDAVPPGVAPRYETGPSIPRHWPLDAGGFLTRGVAQEGSDEESHPGLDIAAPMGTPIRAAGGGRVRRMGVDEDYGLFVLLEHPDGYQTLYGHASRLLVVEGEDVAAGQVIALTGNSGRSTAPHLHFEVRRAGRSIDPSTVVKVSDGS